MSRTPRGTVKEKGAPAGAVLVGIGRVNRGLRVRIREAQHEGRGGPIEGAFQVLDAGSGDYSEELGRNIAKKGRTFPDAGELISLVRARQKKCRHILNCNMLRLEDTLSEKAKRTLRSVARQLNEVSNAAGGLRYLRGHLPKHWREAMVEGGAK